MSASYEKPCEPSGGSFDRLLPVIAALGLALRVAYLVVSRHTNLDGDGRYYHAIAGLLADGRGFIEPGAYARFGRSIAWAPHPPLWPLLLSVPARLGLRTLLEQQVFAALVGTTTIIATGFAARRLAGPRVGLIAATVAAVAPTFFVYERELLSETLVLLGVAVTLLLAFRFSDHPSMRRALAVGMACGLLALTHGEQVLLIPLLLVPLLLLTKGIAASRRLRWMGATVVVAIGVIAPWSIYNSTRFRDPVLIAADLGPTLVEANCDLTYSAERLGYADARCRLASPNNIAGPHGDASTRDSAMRREAIDYATSRSSRLPVVVLAREARAWGLFRIGQQVHFESSRGTSPRLVELGFLTYWATASLAIGGAFVLRRRGGSLCVLAAFPVTVTAAVAMTFGSVRYRAAAEVPMALLAAVAIAALDRGLVGPLVVADQG